MTNTFIAAYSNKHGWAARSFDSDLGCFNYLFDALIEEMDITENPLACADAETLRQISHDIGSLPDAAIIVFNDWFRDWFWVAEG